jgi:hypothetical protein
MLQNTFSLVRLLCSSGAAAAALPELQQLSASACRHFWQLAAHSSSSSTWNSSPHQLPPLVKQSLDIPSHEIEEGEQAAEALPAAAAAKLQAVSSTSRIASNG